MEKVHTDKSPGRTTRDDIDGNSILPIIGEIYFFTGLVNFSKQLQLMVLLRLLCFIIVNYWAHSGST